MSIASSLHVTHSAEDTNGWERWTLGHNPDGPHHFTCSPTYVIRGPSCLIVSGDMGDMIFERSGGVSLNFARNGFRYVAEKCRAGDPWMYDADKARTDLLADLRETFADSDKDEETANAEKFLDAEELDFEDERGVWQWYYDNVSCDDVPHFGRVPSHTLFRVLGCIEAVRRTCSQIETSRTSDCTPYNGHERYTLTMHERIPADSTLATRLASGYYTAPVPLTAYPVPRPIRPDGSVDDAVWEVYLDTREKHSLARREWLAAASERQREVRQEEFRTDLIAALGIQGHRGAMLVEAAEDTAKEWGAQYAHGRDDTDYDDSAPLDDAELQYAADITARFATLNLATMA